MEKINNNIETEEEVYYGVGSFLWEVVKVFFWALIIIVPIRVFLFQPFFVQGASMEPNFKDGDYLIVNELGYKETSANVDGMHLFTVGSFKELSRGDVVVFRYPRDPKQFFIKRVIGLPGEQVKVEAGKVTIYNDENPEGLVLDERAYLSAGSITNGTVTTTIKDNEYFVLGDNRQFSHDSRAWGALPENDVVGKVLIRAWPFTKAEIL
ncbi:MAG TPA: signal peptidase I [Candidatus Moranbacteria bacterium]|nr:signal peptidase I [Candidatus Moranbacteria bacterium]HBT46245.1 signal peptidase I [Candidatus Moranbacteria bacterium]